MNHTMLDSKQDETCSYTKNLISSNPWQRFTSTLDPDDQAALLKILDALVTKTKLRALTANAS